MILLHRSKPLLKDLPIISSPKKIYDLSYNNQSLVLRNMSYEDLERIRTTWAKQEGWSSMRYATPAIYSLDPEGFYLLANAQDTLASISVVSYPEIKTAYVGFYIVPPQYRGQGYGKLIFAQATKHTQQRGITTIGLDCLDSMQEMYQAWGFKTAYSDDLWKYVMPAVSNLNPLIKHQEVEMSLGLFEKILAYDTAVFGAKRHDYLKLHIEKLATITVVCVENDQVTGYGVISEREPAKDEPHKSYRIGPLYANDLQTAEQILINMLEAVDLQPGQAVFMETPSNEPCTVLLNMLGFNKFCSMHRMFKGPLPNHDTDKIFAYSSLAVG